MNITRNRTPGAESLYGNTTNDKLKLPFGKRLSARTGALALAASLGGFGAGWAAHDHFDSQSQAPDKTVEQANAATVVPTPEITASKEPSPADLEPLDAVMNRAAEAFLEKCKTDECFIYYPEENQYSGYSGENQYADLPRLTNTWGVLQHDPNQGGSPDKYSAKVYFDHTGKIDLSEGIKNVAAVHRLGTKDFQGGVMGENNLSDSDANVDSILGVLGLDTSEQ